MNNCIGERAGIHASCVNGRIQMARLVSLQVGSVQLAWVNLVHLHSVQLSSNLLGLRFCHPLNPPYASTPSPRNTHSAGLDYPGEQRERNVVVGAVRKRCG